MSVIYTLQGRAREYAALACNLYQGCSHRCTYCYAPAVVRKTMEQWGCDWPKPRRNILQNIEREAKKLAAAGCQDEILLSFMTDPYHTGDTTTTREAIQIMGEAGLRMKVLTKGGFRAQRDFDLFVKYGVKFGQTIITTDDIQREKWEPMASRIMDRMDSIRQAKLQRIETWVSVDPVINPVEALRVIWAMVDYVDHWKIGKIDNHQVLKDAVDWSEFVYLVDKLLEGKDYYIKKDLAKHRMPAKLFDDGQNALGYRRPRSVFYRIFLS